MSSKRIIGGFSVVGILADWTDVLSYFEEHLSKCNVNIENPESVEKVIFWIALVILLGIVSCSIKHFVLKQRNIKLCSAGTRGIPCTLDQYRLFKFENRTEDIQNAIHRDLYHCVYAIKMKLEKLRNSKSVNVITLRDIPDMNLLLQYFHSTLYKIYNIDASISIYSISETSDNCLILTREMFLRSKDEEKMANRRILKNKYLIANDPQQSIQELTRRAKIYCDNHGKSMFHKNSVFDFILSNPYSSWLSNNLEVDSENNNFFTSSENYKVFYNSLAAFAILPPENIENRDSVIKGILTFDTKKTGMYLEKECITIMGLMAHLVNEIIES